MNTLNFFQRLQPFLAVDDVTTMPQTSKLAVLTAINDAATDWARAVPALHKTHPDGYALFPAPTTVSVSVTSGSTAISGLTAADIGKTITLPGDEVVNRLVSATKLRVPFVGTTGTVSATLYGDAYALPANWEAMAGSVFWERAQDRRELSVAGGDLYRTRRFSGTEIRLADPEYYQIETGQTLDGNGAPRAILRLVPIPGDVQRLSFDYIGPPAAWSMTDFATAREMGLTDAHWIYIATMALGKLVKVPGVLKAEANVQMILADAATALEQVRSARPTQTPTPLMVGTPWNW